jgi:hypothetical protein
MNRSSSKIRHIQKSNLILESRYLFEGNLTLTQILQGKQLLSFNRKDEENVGKNGVYFSHGMENNFKPDYSNIDMTFGVDGRKDENVRIGIYCENPEYIKIARKITESLNGIEDVQPIVIDDNGDETDKREFGYEVTKIISLENLNLAFENITKVVGVPNAISDEMVDNPYWVK